MYVTAIGGLVQTFVPAFIGRDYDFDARLGIRVLKPRIYLGSDTCGARTIRLSAIGTSVEASKNCPTSTTSSRGTAALSTTRREGHYAATVGLRMSVRPLHVTSYDVLKYDIGVDYSFQGIPLFIEGGFLGDRGWNNNAAPIGFSESGPYAVSV